MDVGSPWFVFGETQRTRDAQFRLFCFHYAGSGASMFRPWTQWLSEGIELVAVQLPGREDRLDEPLLSSMDHVTTALADALPPLLDKPFAFFGHSTGAVIGFELARVLRRRGLPQPRLLIASSQNAPQVPPAVLRHQLSDPEFIEVIRGCQGTPDVVLGNPALLELLLPRIRADGTIYETYRCEPQAPLDCPIVVLHGLDDGLVDGEGLASWQEQTRHRVRRYAFPGGHFFLHEAAEVVVQRIDHELEPFLGEGIASEGRTEMDNPDVAHCTTDEELFALMRAELSTPPVSDVMEQLGFRFPMLPPEIRPLRSDVVMIGRAMPVQDEPPVPYGSPTRFDAKPFGLLFESIEALRPNEVYVASGGPTYAARLGDMLITRAQRLGAAGIVIDAHVRDANGIVKLDIPVFAHGSYAYGLQRRHNVVDVRCSITIGKTRIRPGDLIFGDGDGVCVLPREAEREILGKALAKTRMERNVRDAIEAGCSVVDAFKTYGVM